MNIEIVVEPSHIGAKELFASFGFFTGEEIEFRGEHCVPVIVNMITVVKRKVKTLSIRCGRHDGRNLQQKLELPSDYEAIDSKHSFAAKALRSLVSSRLIQDLQELEISAFRNRSLSPKEDNQIYVGMAEFLHAATKLEKLILDFSSFSHRIEYSDLLLKHLWSKKLKHLNLSGFRSTRALGTSSPFL